MPISDYHVVGDASLARPVPPSPYAEKTDIEGPKTAQGNPLTLSDSAPVNAVNVSVDVEPIQDLHGYDYPWVGGAGKNKLPMTVDGIKAANGGASTWNGNSKTIGGVAFTILTDSDRNVTGIRCNGHANGFSFYAFDGSITVPSGSKINLNATKNNGNFDCNAVNNGTGIGYISGYLAQTADVTLSDTTVTRVAFYFNSNYNDDITIYPMIRNATEDSTFAPYTNICPISGRSELAIDRVGVNLLDISTSNENRSIKADGDLQYASERSVSDYIKVKSNQNYYASHVTGGYYVRTFAFYDNNKTFLSVSGIQGGIDVSGSITTPNNASYLRMCYTTANTNIQLELGNQATSYEPYQGTTYTIQLGQEVYGGRLDMTRGKLVVDRRFVTYDGSENWAIAWNDTMVYYESSKQITDGKILPTATYGIQGISNEYEWLAYETADNSIWKKRATNTEPYTAFAIKDNGNVFVKDVNCADANALKTYLASNPLQVVYELATPIEIDLTPIQIKLLENTNTLYTDYEGDTIHIEYQPNNAIGEAVMTVEESYDAIIQNLIDRVTALENQ